MFINFDEFLEHLLLFRVVWIRGRLGGGKTLLGMAIADKLLRMGMVDGLITNLPSIMPPALGEDDGTLMRRVVVFDEAWTHLDSRSSLVNPQQYGAYARKLETYWIFPSVHQIDKRLRSITVWLSGRFAIPFFPPIWVYRWTLDLDYEKESGGWFALVRPQSYFGVYDTKHIPSDDGGIEGRWMRSIAAVTDGEGLAKPERIGDFMRELRELGGIEALGDAS